MPPLTIYTNFGPALNSFMANPQIIKGGRIIFAAAAAGATFFTLDQGNAGPPGSNSQSNTNIGVMPALIYLQAADYPSINGKTAKLRIRYNAATNHTAPGCSFVGSLNPLTSPASSGGSGFRQYTIGAAVPGSDGAGLTLTTPAADTMFHKEGSWFAFPANGWYCICFTSDGATAANSYTEFSAQLEVHYE